MIEYQTPKGSNAIQILNLNIPHLATLRGAEIAGFIFDENDDLLPTEDIEKLLSIIKQKQNDKFHPFCVVLECILKKFLLNEFPS